MSCSASGLIYLQCTSARRQGDRMTPRRQLFTKYFALIVSLEPLFQQQRNQIVELAARHRLPSIGAYGEYVEAGGLMSYGYNLRDTWRRAATYVDKIFKGANPGDLPVEQPTRFELFINRKTAKTLGITIPQSILVRADKVIE